MENAEQEQDSEIDLPYTLTRRNGRNIRMQIPAQAEPEFPIVGINIHLIQQVDLSFSAQDRYEEEQTMVLGPGFDGEGALGAGSGQFYR